MKVSEALPPILHSDPPLQLNINVPHPAAPGRVRSIGRIHLIDNFRGAALVAILVLHCVEHFSLYVYPEDGPAWLLAADRAVLHAAFLLFFGKAHAVFALLFGVSYHIQERNNLRNGIGHRARMLRRMGWLFIFGMLHGLFYPGDILCILAAYGVLLILLAHLPSSVLLSIAIVLALQPILLIKGSIGDGGPLFSGEAERMQGLIFSLQHDGVLHSALNNTLHNRITETMLTISSGRIFQLGSWMLIGIVAARKGYFQDPHLYRRVNWRVLVAAVILYALLAIILPADPLWTNAIERWKETVMVLIYITAGMVAASYWKLLNTPTLLASYGKMSLTNYITQGVLGSILFHGHGFGLYHLGATLSLIPAIAILSAQLIFTWWWSLRHTRGPLEGLWGKLASRSSGKKVQAGPGWHTQ